MNRDRRIDTLRGIFLAIMTIDHLGGYLTKFTAQPLGYVSAAEGFIFLSGFVCMEVYGRNLDNLKKVTIKTFERSVKIYKYHVFIVLLLPLISFFVPYYVSYWKYYLSPYYAKPITTILFELIFLHKPMYMDILPMYSIFLAICPLIFVFIKNEKTLLLLLISISIWALSQYINPIVVLTKFISNQLSPGYFNIFSWQFIFILGIVSNHYKKSLTVILKNKTMIVFISLFSLSFFVMRHTHMPINSILFSERADFPSHNLINFIFLAPVISIIISKFKRTAYLPVFEYLGKNSLQVFSFQIVLSYLCLPFTPRIFTDYGSLGQSIFALIMVLALIIPTYIYNNCYKFMTGKSIGRKLAAEAIE